MKRALFLAIVLAAADAHAIDPIAGSDVNKPLTCKATGETFFPYGDTWAFLPGGACKGTDPTMVNGGLGAEDPAGKADVEGHCMWVNFDDQGPIAKTTVTGGNTEHAERARKVVFAAMRKWAGYKMGKATLGNPLEWSCPTTSQTVTDPKTSFQTAQSYDFGVGNSAKPTLNFYRGQNVPAIANNTANRGDDSECLAPCKAGQNCSSLMGTPGPSGTTFYPCTSGVTDGDNNRFRYKSVRHNVVWVRGSGQWKAVTQQPPTVLASTEVTFWPDNGVIVTADMMINNENIDWQFHDPEKSGATAEGCDPNSATCYYLETVATHEAGHWIGLGHVECSEAVMVPTATSNDQKYDLSKHELAGACSIYRPSSEGRFPSKSRQGEGCLNDGQCNGEAGLKCLFSNVSFYTDATALGGAAAAAKIPHRGVCVKASGCTSDDDCDKTRGLVCQTFDEATNARYCMVGSGDRPRTLGSVGDFCIPCDDGTQCNGVCASTAADGLNIKLASGAPPARMCTVRCEKASGCAAGFECKTVGQTSLCVPNNPDQCITNAAASRAQINEACGDTKACAAGLDCFALNNVNVCLESCSTTRACRTPGFGCLLQLEKDEQGKVVQLDHGVCFKKDMKEGDNCSLGSSSLCGLNCTGSGASEVCSPKATQACFYDSRGPQFAQCYSLCTTGMPPVACPQAGQSCTPFPMSQAGYCTPLAGARCLKGTGEECAADAECDSNLCQAFGAVKTCTSLCDVTVPGLCPTGTTCTDIGGKGACKPTAQPLPTKCGVATNGCRCGEMSEANALEIFLVALAVLWMRRRRA